MVHWIQWYGHGAEGHPDIKSGKGSVEDIVSHHQTVQQALDRHQAVIAAKARSNLETRAKNRSGDATIGTKQPSTTKLDRYVYMKDSGQNSWAASASIEFGHWNVHPRTKERRWVDGLWILHDAAGIPHG